MIRRALILAAALGALAATAAPAASAAEGPCEQTPRYKCFGLASLDASLSVSKEAEEEGILPTQAGGHPDLTFSFAVSEDPETETNKFGLHDSYAATRDVRIELPPGLVGNPNVLGEAEQCQVAELLAYNTTGGCPNGSQVGITQVYLYEFETAFREPVYMMQPPGGDVVARLGFIAGLYATFIDLRVRSDSDYGITAEIVDASAEARLLKAETTTWGVPSDPSHDTERCTPAEAFLGCVSSVDLRISEALKRLPFLTNPTRCGTPLEMRVGAASWLEPERFDFQTASFPEITGCNSLPFGPGLEVEPSTHRAASPSGANVTIKLPASAGVKVLEPSQMRDITVALPQGFAFNPSAGDGLETCSPAQVGIGTSEASHCPDAAKLASTEFDIPVLERNLKGAVYLREPEPGHPFRIWITADDLGLHVKLEGELEVDKQSGQITEVTTEVPQAPVREAKLSFKSGLRAPLVTPDRCGTFDTSYEFTPWSGNPSVSGKAPMTISEGCDTGGFNPKLSAGTTDPAAGQHSPFVFDLTREDGEQNPASLDIALPTGLAATFAGIPRCEGAAAETGQCPAASQVGHVTAAVGAGTAPLWVPQAGKRPTAVYLGGPYKGAPTSIIAVVPKQAGPFDFGDEVVRSAVYVDPVTAQATVRSDPLPQLIEGIPIGYRDLHVAVDRPDFTLNPTGCEAKRVEATVASAQGALAHPSAPFAAVNCAALGFKPRLGLKLRGGTKRGSFPALHLVYRPRPGDANLKHLSLRFPKSEFIEQGHFRTICTRVQFAAGEGFGSECPKGSVYGRVKVFTPLLDEPLTGLVYLRSSNHNLPDAVLALQGPPSLPIQLEVPTRIDSVHGGLRVSSPETPDAPITAVVVDQQGGAKGLFVNSTNLCAAKHRATVNVEAHNGRTDKLNPVVRAVKCKKAHRKRHKGHKKKNGGKHKGKKH